MGECDDDCVCAVCDTLVMRPSEDWKATPLPEGVVGTCVFCKKRGQLAYYTALGMSVGTCCRRGV